MQCLPTIADSGPSEPGSMDTLDRAIRELCTACRNRRVPRSAVLAWPELGERLSAYIYGGRSDELLAAGREMSAQRQSELAVDLHRIAQFSPAEEPTLLTVGTANAENILNLPGDFQVGKKHLVEVDELYGGGGVNHSLRLLTAGYDVFPVLPVGDDSIGHQIRDRLVVAAREGNVSRRVTEFCHPNPDTAFFEPHISTPTSTIVVDGKQRTILAQELRNGQNFIDHVARRCDAVEQVVPDGPSTLMIGHLQSDGAHINPDRPGHCTAYLLERFGGQAMTFVNFGLSQIELGYEFWKKLGVLNQIDVLQLNLDEAKQFFSDSYDQRRPLPSIVDVLRKEQLTAVITLDRFGALGVHRALTDSVIIAWPAIDVADVIDATGAGDAFAAGLMSYLSERKRVTPGAFQTAIEVGRIWAARACSTIGAAGECPSQVSLYEFAQSLPSDGRRASEVRIPDNAREIMSLLDIAFH